MVQEYEIDPTGAALEFRKHLGWYVKGLPGSAELRKRLHQVNSFDEVEGIFSDYLVMGARGDLAGGERELDAELLEAGHA
jgi:tRNA-dihydrouridine synthase